MEKMPGVPLANLWINQPVASHEMVRMDRDLLSLENRFLGAGFASFGSLYFKVDVSPEFQK